jgi:hypothetical protein
MKYLNEQRGRLIEIAFNDSNSSSDTLFSKVRKGKNIDPSKLTLCGKIIPIKADNRSKSTVNKSKLLRDELGLRIQKFEYSNNNPDYIVVSDLDIFIVGDAVLYQVAIQGVKLIK